LAGFPTAIDAINLLRAVVEERPANQLME